MELKTFMCDNNSFYLVDVPSKSVHEGYPLDSISKVKEIDKYFTELEDEEKSLYKKSASRDKIINFIIENV